MQKLSITQFLWVTKSLGLTLKKIPLVMKLFFVFMLSSISFLHASDSYAQTARISLDIKNQTVQEVLEQIEAESDFSFFYNDRHVDLNRKVSVSVNDTDIFKILEAVFSGTNVGYSVVENRIVLSIKSSNPVIAQKEKKITGTVVDVTGIPVVGANVMIKGTTNGTVTDIDGKFSLSAEKGDILEVSYIGYLPCERKIGNESTLAIILKEDMKVLDEIVVTGYGGTVSRSKLTNSITTVKEETFDIGLYANPAQALSGAVAGLRVIQNSGDPGAAPVVVLRGGTNLDGTGNPMIYVDGQLRSNMTDINPADIESMEVLKDAGATALYGARANNGIILITTKSGKSGRTEITVNAKVSLSYLNNPYEFMNGGDYLHWMRTAVKNASQVWQNKAGVWQGYTNMSSLTANGAYGTGNLYWDPANPGKPLDGNLDIRAMWSPMILSDDNRFLLEQGWKTMTDPIYGDQIIYKEFDHTAAAFQNPAVTQDYNISLSGGNDKGHYYASLGYYDAESLPVDNYYKRMTIVINADYKIKPWLTSYSNFSFSHRNNQNLPSWSNVSAYFGSALSAPPTLRGVNADGEWVGGTANVQQNRGRYKSDLNMDKLIFGQTFKFDIMKGLSLKINGYWQYEKRMDETFTKDYQTTANTWVRTRASKAEYDELRRQTYNAVANYDISFRQHSLSVLAGAEFFEQRVKGFSASGSGAPTDDFADLALTLTSANKRSIDSWHSCQRILSFMGRLNYDYQDKYLFSATLRRDGYSTLINNRWGVFPGVSVGWIFGREQFMADLSDIVSFAKLRASYGVNGNVSGVGEYELQGAYSNIKYNGEIAYRLSTLSNPSLRWERSNTFEAGLDFSLFQNRVNVNTTWYNRKTVDKFASIPLPASSGVSSIRSNNGSMQNRGVELELNFRILQQSDWKWDLSANMGFNKNKILKLPDNGLELNRQNAIQVYSGNGDELIWVGGYQEGQRPGDIYAYKMEGIFKSEEEVRRIAGSRVDKSVNTYGSGKPLYGPEIWDTLTDAEKANAHPIQAGDVIWKDVNNDGVIDVYDKVYIGNNTPKVTGGISNNLSWKGITLSVRMDYALGHYQHDTQLPWFMGCQQGSFNLLTTSKDTWTPENPNAKYPKYYWADQNGKRNYARTSNSMFVYNASYLCFRELSLSYACDSEWIQKIGASKLSFSITGQNLGYLTKTKSYTPEQNQAADVGAGYSLPRTVIFGASVTF